MSSLPAGVAFWKGLAAALGGVVFTVFYLVVGLAIFLPQGGAPLWADIPIYVGLLVMVSGPLWFWLGRPAVVWWRGRSSPSSSSAGQRD